MRMEGRGPISRAVLPAGTHGDLRKLKLSGIDQTSEITVLRDRYRVPRIE